MKPEAETYTGKIGGNDIRRVSLTSAWTKQLDVVGRKPSEPSFLSFRLSKTLDRETFHVIDNLKQISHSMLLKFITNK